ncbi:MAG: hypothetical protein JXB36_16275 [Gammaproteobacteria bacterium]|nr:hypothetical protein [Gammaproteobacteria bacterium]
MTRGLAALLLLASSGPSAAQWLTLATPGIPRTADGRPDLSAPAPRTADDRPELTGLWRVVDVRGDLRDESKVQPWARESMAVHERNFFRDGPQMQCLPGGPAYIVGGPAGGGTLRRIVQSPTVTAMLYADLTYRQIFTDGRALEPDPLPIWTGYSVGRWEGDTLVVESNGYNEKSWLQADGLQHTENLRITERYRRPDFGHIEVDVTYDDPGTFDAPLHAAVVMEYAADDEMLEIVCNEASEGGTKHWVGDKVADAEATAVEVAPDILAKYVGTYQGIWLDNPTTVEVTLEGASLFLRRNGGDKARLVPQSETSFICSACTWSQPYVFNRDGDGMASSVEEVQVSGRWVFDRVE